MCHTDQISWPLLTLQSVTEKNGCCREVILAVGNTLFSCGHCCREVAVVGVFNKKSLSVNTCMDSAVDSGEGPRPLFLDQTEAPKAQKNYFLRRPPPPPLFCRSGSATRTALPNKKSGCCREVAIVDRLAVSRGSTVPGKRFAKEVLFEWKHHIYWTAPID